MEGEKWECEEKEKVKREVERERKKVSKGK